MATVAAAAAIVVAEVGADDPLDVAVVAVKLVAVERPAVEGGEWVALGERVVEQWVVVRRVGAAPAPGCSSP